MSRTKILIFVCIVIVHSFSSAGAYTPNELQVGERYVYTIKWLGIPVGEIKAVVEAETVIKGREVFIIQCYAQTNKWMSLIYKIQDRFVSYIDKERLVPLKLKVSRREGSYKKDAVTVFDHENGKAYFHNFLDNSYKEYDIPPEVQDIISIFYKLRHHKIVLDKAHYYDVAFAETVFSISGTASTKRTIKLPTGRRASVFYAEPYAKIRRKEIKDGTMSTYISSDGYQIPYRIVLKAPLFTKVTATLTEATALRL